MGRRRNEGNEPSGRWLTTFNDLVTLLLTFFVLTLSLSKLDEAKMKKMSRSVSDAMGRLEAGSLVDIQIFHPFILPMRRYGIPVEREKGALAARINEKGVMEAKVIEEGVRIIMDERVLFKSGKADIEKDFVAGLEELCRELEKSKGEIRVEGHTDDVPIDTFLFPSNWELSSARACRIVRFLIDEGGISPERLSVAGYGDSRPHACGHDDSNKFKNRRVEIVVITSKSKEE
ncbi:MAG: OmpA family protein [Syntrophales bacterium]|nr:OmpA family protein [Syntrophales bacterium]MDY0043109.1 OmpA family protein [Syntrophales bacterium]